MAASSNGSGAGKDNPKEPWCSLLSVLDIKVTPKGVVPIDPPVANFLEEATLGLRNGSGDKRSRAVSSTLSSPRRGAEATPAERVEKLEYLISLPEAAVVGKALFWIAMGTIFGRIPDSVLCRFREQLGTNWYLLYLEVIKAIPTDSKVRDWVLAAFPFVYAQAIYRLIYVAFEEDRKAFNEQADALLDKASLVAHFEITGFQLTPDTVHKSRRRLFLDRVLKNPQMDQREILRGQQRQEMLEGNQVADLPLRFGRADGRGLDDSQLEDVMHGRREVLNKQRGIAPLLGTRGIAEIALQAYTGPDLVPAELSVDRYEDLVDGGALFEQHLAELNLALGKQPAVAQPVEAEPGDDFRPDSPMSGASPGPSPPVSPTFNGNAFSTSTPISPKHGKRPLISFEDCSNASSPRAGNFEDAGSEPPTPSSPNKRFQNVAAAAGGKSRWKHATAALKEQLKDKKEREAKERLFRQEQLYSRVANDPLPSELCERELYTTWVSPVTKMLLPAAEDRFVLRKRAADAYRLTMATPNTLTRPLSMPALRTSGRAGSQAEQPGAGGATSTADSTLPSLVPAGTTGSPTSVAANPGFFQSQRVMQDTISLGPPPHVSGKLAMHRLEDQKKGFNRQSFALYMKEYDILSGKRKVPVDPKRLEEDETTYLQKMGDMNAGLPKRMVPPASMMRGRMRNTL